MIELEDEDVETFEYFAVWLYTHNFERSDDQTDNFDMISRLLLFADRRHIPLLSNMMIDTMRDTIATDWVVPTKCLDLIYENTTPESALRKFVVWVISHACDAGILSGKELWPPDAIWDLLNEVWKLKDSGMKRLSKASLAKADLGPYHQHEEGVKCLKPDKEAGSTSGAAAGGS